MDTTDLLLLVIGIGCLSTAFAALMRDPEPEPEPLVKDAAPLAYGGVVQRAKPARADYRPACYVVPDDFARMRGALLMGNKCEHGWKVVAPTIEAAAEMVESMWCRVPDEEDAA
jgi:hypothetical protein